MSDEKPAEVIRRAAKLMRELAEGCEPRRWYWKALGEKRYPQRVSSEGNVSLIAETFIDPAHRPYEAEHIASWHPLVTLAVADWLETEAINSDAYAGNGNWLGAPSEHALKIARTYLGEGS